MKLEIPGVTKESWRTGDEQSFREAKPGLAQIMELELPHRFRMRARILDLTGFEDFQYYEREVFLA